MFQALPLFADVTSRARFEPGKRQPHEIWACKVAHYVPLHCLATHDLSLYNSNTANNYFAQSRTRVTSKRDVCQLTQTCSFARGKASFAACKCVRRVYVCARCYAQLPKCTIRHKEKRNVAPSSFGILSYVRFIIRATNV